MKKVLTAGLICLLVSGLSGCASIRAKNNPAVCFPPWDFNDPAIMSLNSINWAKVVGLACFCEPKNKACK